MAFGVLVTISELCKVDSKVTAVTVSRRAQDSTTAETVTPVRDPRGLTRAYMGHQSFGNSTDRENDGLQPRLQTQSQPQSRAPPPLL